MHIYHTNVLEQWYLYSHLYIKQSSFVFLSTDQIVFQFPIYCTKADKPVLIYQHEWSTINAKEK